MKWDKKIPTNKRLTVYVRFETSDERIMETTSDIIIDPPSELSIVQQGGDYDSEFVQLEEDEVQGWYKSQTVRGRSEDEDTRGNYNCCLLYTSPSPRDATLSRMPSSA